jgi:ribonuclease VapC
LVVDTSVLLAVFFNEKMGPWAADQLQAHRHDLLMSTVTYAEALILAEDRQPGDIDLIRESVEASSLRLIAPDRQQAELAAAARLRYPLNLGDCFAYALAKQQNCPILTLDRDFRNTDLAVILPRTR